MTVSVKDYDGKLLNGPNDVWVRPTAASTSPTRYYKRAYWTHAGPQPQDGQDVYYLSPDRKTLTRVADDLKQPNGIIGTPDGKTLYVADIGAARPTPTTSSPTARSPNKRLFCELGSDGMTIDNEGNVYLTGKGVTVFDKAGKQIEDIDVPEAGPRTSASAARTGRRCSSPRARGCTRSACRVKGANAAK